MLRRHLLEYQALTVEVRRGTAVESRHRVSASLRLRDGARGGTYGDPGAAAFWRSALKPFQALAIVQDGVLAAYGLDTADLAVICASHGGTPEHTARVAGILDRIRCGEPDLHCGPHTPYDTESAAALLESGRGPGRLHNNCSGKHASMLALALHRGWSTDGYWRFEHPVQSRMRDVLSEWIDVDPESLEWATDGCGVPTPLIQLSEMAEAYRRLAASAGRSGSAAEAVVEAMTAYPELTSSPGREPLVIMRGTSGRLLAKEGAEGVLCVAAMDDAWGLALKVEDGARRAVGPAVMRILSGAGLLRGEELEFLNSLTEVPILSTRGEVVGGIRAAEPREIDSR